MTQHKFTVIIPTRERANTLLYSLQTCVAQPYANLDILVSDNCSNDNTKEIVERFTDKRIKYINTGQRLSMAKNYEFALSHVTEGWVCIIGDDDGLLPDSITVANNIVNANTTADVLFWYHLVPRYFWSGEFGGTANDNKFLCREMHHNAPFVPKDRLEKMMSFESSYEALPIIYHGFVAVELINTIKKAAANGCFFQARIPDVYSTIALSIFSKNVVQCSQPISIQGISNNSIGESRIFKKRSNQTEQQFLSEADIPFNTSLALLPTDKPMDNIHILSTDAFLYFFENVVSEYSTEKNKYREYVLLHLSKKIKQQNDPIYVHLANKILIQNNLQNTNIEQNDIYLKLKNAKKYFYYIYSHKIYCTKYGLKTIADIFNKYNDITHFSGLRKIDYQLKKAIKFVKRYAKFILKID